MKKYSVRWFLTAFYVFAFALSLGLASAVLFRRVQPPAEEATFKFGDSFREDLPDKCSQGDRYRKWYPDRFIEYGCIAPNVWGPFSESISFESLEEQRKLLRERSNEVRHSTYRGTISK